MLGILDCLKVAGLEPVAEPYPEILGPAADKDAPDSLNPVGGDHQFTTYLIPGAAFQALDSSQWLVNDITPNGMYNVMNWWYPREWKMLTYNELRKCIESWIDPVLQHVPPPKL